MPFDNNTTAHPCEAPQASTPTPADIPTPKKQRFIGQLLLWPSTLFQHMRRAFKEAREDRATTLLRETRALIANKHDWLQGIYERDGRHCAMGALQTVGRAHPRGVRRTALARLLAYADAEGYHSVESLNDSVEHAAVLAMFDAAIANQKQDTRAK